MKPSLVTGHVGLLLSWVQIAWNVTAVLFFLRCRQKHILLCARGGITRVPPSINSKTKNIQIQNRQPIDITTRVEYGVPIPFLSPMVLQYAQPDAVSIRNQYLLRLRSRIMQRPRIKHLYLRTTTPIRLLPQYKFAIQNGRPPSYRKTKKPYSTQKTKKRNRAMILFLSPSETSHRCRKSKCTRAKNKMRRPPR